MKKILATCLAVIAFIILPVSAALSDNNEPSGSSDDTQFALRDTGMLLARAEPPLRARVDTYSGTSGKTTTSSATMNSADAIAGAVSDVVPAGSGTKTDTGPTCGNGRIETGEECDQGSANNGACPRVCSSTCTNNVSCCHPCTIGTHIFTEICNADSCCVRFRDQSFVRLSALDRCMEGHPYRQYESGTEFIDYPRDDCGDRLIYDLPLGGTREQCDPPGVQGACASGQICGATCQCELETTNGPVWNARNPIIPVCGDRRISGDEECEPGVLMPASRAECLMGRVCTGCRCVEERPPADSRCFSRHGNHPMPEGSACCDKECKDLQICIEGYCEPTRAPLNENDCREYRAEYLAEDCGTPPAARPCTSAFGNHLMNPADNVCCGTGCKELKACQERFCPATGAIFPFTDANCRLYAKAIETAAGTDPDCPAVPPTCVPNGRPEGGEQCDTFELSEAAARAQLLERCTPPADGQEVFNCDMRDCSCAYIQTACAGRTIDGAIVQCRSSLDCAVGNICDSDCQCRTIPPPPPPPPPEPPVAERRQDCSVEVISFSSDAAKEKLDKLNKKEIAEITGRTDLDVYAEREQMARVVCVTKAVSQTAGKGAVTYNGTVSDHVMTSWDNITTSRPMQLIQTGGSVFIDFNNTDQMQFKRVELVEQPVRILPLEGQTGISLSEAVPIGTLLPNITSSVSSTGDAANVNNMIEYQGFNLGAGQTYSFNASGSVDIQNAEGAPVVSGADRIDVFNFRLPIGCATWTAVEGYIGCKPVEEQEHDPAAVNNFIKAQVIPGEFVKSSVVYGAPWEKIDNFTFILDRGAGAPGIPDPGAAAATRGANVAVTATRGGGGIPSTPVGGTASPSSDDPVMIGGLPDPNQTSGSAVQHKFAILAADPAWLGEGSGGCKGCYVNGTAAGAGEMMPALVALIAAVGGIMAGRKWKRCGKKTKG